MEANGNIRPIAPHTSAYTEALALVWRVFEQYEGPDYSPEGVAEFRAFIDPAALAARMEGEGLQMWGFYVEEVLAGVIALRPPCHISLLFVDGAHHRRGIARRLYAEALAQFRVADPSLTATTVNASPYALEAYRRLGFTPTAPEQTVNGLVFTPMQHAFAAVGDKTAPF